MQIDVLIYPGFDELDAIAPYEVLKVAAASGAEFEVRFVSQGGPSEIVANHGTRLRSEASLDAPARAALLIVPGGGWGTGADIGARAEVGRGLLPQRLADLYAGGTDLAAVCTGAMLLAAAGLLRGRPATTHHAAVEDLAQVGARIVRARVVDAGRIITSGGVTSGLDLALWLVERFAGPAIANQVETRLEYERRGTVWRATGLPSN